MGMRGGQLPVNAMCECVEDFTQTSARIRSSSYGRCDLARGRADTEADGEDDFEMQ